MLAPSGTGGDAHGLSATQTARSPVPPRRSLAQQSRARAPGACSRARAERPADCASERAGGGVTARQTGVNAHPGRRLQASYRAKRFRGDIVELLFTPCALALGDPHVMTHAWR
jgi:hypothetical protein